LQRKFGLLRPPANKLALAGWRRNKWVFYEPEFSILGLGQYSWNQHSAIQFTLRAQGAFANSLVGVRR